MGIEDEYVAKSSNPSVSTQVSLCVGATQSPIFPSPVTTSSPAPHPYLWGNQHHFVPIDGNPIWYPASSSIALNAYPSIAGGATLINLEAEGMVLKKNSNSEQKFEGSSNHVDVVGLRSGESGSLPSVSGFDGTSQRAAGGRDASDENANKHEDELRKEKRKQANRESAKRSRLRKQEECKKLQAVAKTLKLDNSFLREELLALSEKCMEYESENKSIMEELIQTYGPGAISDLEVKYPEFFRRYLDDKRNSSDTEIQSTISMREETPSENTTSPYQNTEH